MQQHIRLVHPCRAVIVLVTGHRRAHGELGAHGTYYDDKSGEAITQCPGCREWLGSAFIAASPVRPDNVTPQSTLAQQEQTTARCGR